MSSTGIAALDTIDNIIYCLNDVLNPGTRHIPRRSFPNTSMAFQCRKYTTLFNHIRGHLEYQDFQFFSSCLRIKYPSATIAFFTDHFGMKLLHKKELSELGVTFYFLLSPYTPNHDDSASVAVDDDGDGSLWSHRGAVLQLRYDHGAEEDADLVINNGNIEPHRGFGHIAFNVDDVYAHCAAMERNGARFQKKPDEGRMKGLAFAMDPNSYWVEVVRRSEHCGFKVPCNLSQTMLRIKNPEESLRFYCDLMGMRLVTESLV